MKHYQDILARYNWHILRRLSSLDGKVWLLNFTLSIVTKSLTHLYNDSDNPHINYEFSGYKSQDCGKTILKTLLSESSHVAHSSTVSFIWCEYSDNDSNLERVSYERSVSRNSSSRTVKFSHRILNRLEYLEAARRIDISQERFSLTLFIYWNYRLQIPFKPRKMLKTTQSCLLWQFWHFMPGTTMST